MLPLPLNGLRVLDLSHVWAGPYCTMMLADMGAEIVRVESIQRPAATRMVLADNQPGENPWNRTAYFNKLNRNKFGITLDLNSGWGMDILHQLIKLSDVLVESYSPGTMKKMGSGV